MRIILTIKKIKELKDESYEEEVQRGGRAISAWAYLIKAMRQSSTHRAIYGPSRLFLACSLIRNTLMSWHNGNRHSINISVSRPSE